MADSLLLQLAPKERQLQEARARNTSLSEQVVKLSSQLTSLQKDLQCTQEDARKQVKVGLASRVVGGPGTC